MVTTLDTGIEEGREELLDESNEDTRIELDEILVDVTNELKESLVELAARLATDVDGKVEQTPKSGWHPTPQ